MRTSRLVPFAIAVAAMVALTSGPLFRVRSWWDYDDPLGRDGVVVAVHAVFALVALAWLLRHGAGRALDERAGLLAMALVVWLVIGALWSLDRGETLRQSVQIASSLVVGAAAVTALGRRTWRLALWVALHVGLLWSFVAIRLEHAGTIDGNGDWAGVFFNRNSLALYAALGLLVTVFVVADAITDRGGGPGSAVALGTIAVGVVAALVDVRLLAGSDALTPLLAVAVALAAAAGARIVHRRAAPGRDAAARMATIAGGATVVVAAVAWVTRGAWLDAFGRSSDLTGRSDLWAVALDWAWQRPIHGYGYLAAWSDPAFLADIEERRGQLLGSTHNSFVEVFLGAGLVGLVILVLLVVALYHRHAVVALTGPGITSAFGLALLVFVVVENLTETLLVGNQLTVALLGALLVDAGVVRTRR